MVGGKGGVGGVKTLQLAFRMWARKGSWHCTNPPTRISSEEEKRKGSWKGRGGRQARKGSWGCTSPPSDLRFERGREGEALKGDEGVVVGVRFDAEAALGSEDLIG